MGEATFASKIKDVCGVGSLMGGDMIALVRRKGLRAAELEVSTGRVAQRVIPLGLFPFAVAVARK